MKSELFPWQAKALEEPNDYALWCAEAGIGKTYAGQLWLQQGSRSKNPVVLCPKHIKGKWQKAAKHVYTPYEVRTKDLPPEPTAVVIDEADEYAAPLFIARSRSKMAENLYNYLREYPDCPVLLLTATPIRSNPWNLHTLLTYIGRYEDWRDYQKRYFELVSRPYRPRPFWQPVVGWQQSIQKELEANAEIALMKDMVDYLPPETHDIITIKPPKYEKNEEWEATKQFVEDHRSEQREKYKHIKEIGKGFRKAVVVAHYREQIDQLAKELGKERTTYVLDGRSKDVESIIADAEASSECYFIIQASVGAGFELPSFAVMVFASQGYGVRNYVQIRARIKRINTLKPVKYYYLLGGKCDKAIYDSIQAGKDFVPSLYKA